MKIVEMFTARVPEYALPYLVNADLSGLTDMDRIAIDDWFSQYERETLLHPGSCVQFCPGHGEPYFSPAPAFGLACNVLDCSILILAPEQSVKLFTLAIS